MGSGRCRSWLHPRKVQQLRTRAHQDASAALLIQQGEGAVLGRGAEHGRHHQSSLIPANLITLAHFSVSSARSFPNSAGEPASTEPPRSAMRAQFWDQREPRDLLVELVDNFSGSFPGRADAEQRRHLVTRHEFACARNIRPAPRPHRGGDCNARNLPVVTYSIDPAIPTNETCTLSGKQIQSGRARRRGRAL